MKKAALLVCCLLLLSLAAGCAGDGPSSPGDSTPALSPSPSAPAPDEDALWQQVQNAYVFTFPLVILDATARVSTNTREATDLKAPHNQLLHSRQLASADSKEVVTPNVDTIYTRSFLDLTETPLVYTKPAADRFCSVELLDAYTNCVAILGTGGDGQEAGSYLLAGPGFSGNTPDGVTRVDLPTNTAWLLARTMVESPGDLENVYALQEQMELLPLDAYLAGGQYTPPEGSVDPADEFVPVEHVLGLSPGDYFARANELMAVNAPAAEDAAALAGMAEIGVGPGLAFDAEILGEGAEARWRAMLDGLVEELLARTSQFQRVLGCWHFYGPPIAEFGTEYDYRALVALDGLGANPVSVAIYPKADASDDGAALDGKNAYKIHFEPGALPPTLEYGFWSITAYGEDNFLIDNELDRYLISDRSQLAYNGDGSLDILVQAAPPEDPALLGNWLPVRAAPFHLYLRVYLPDEAALAAGWAAPAIERQ